MLIWLPQYSHIPCFLYGTIGSGTLYPVDDLLGTVLYYALCNRKPISLNIHRNFFGSVAPMLLKSSNLLLWIGFLCQSLEQTTAALNANVLQSGRFAVLAEMGGARGWV